MLSTTQMTLIDPGGTMKRSRFTRAVVGLSAAAMVTVGLGVSGAAGAEANPADQFKNLKHMAAPNPCKNDPGITDTEIKIGSIVPTSGPAATFSGIARRHQGAVREAERRE